MSKDKHNEHLDAELYANLPAHPTNPFLRIIGVAMTRPQEVNEQCPWGVAFHVVFPYSPRPRRSVRARIISESNNQIVEELPEVVYPQGPCISHVELYDSRVLVDREFNDVYDVQHLLEGLYRAEAELIDENGEVCFCDVLRFEVGALPYLKHKINLVFDGWKRSPEEARYLAGEALTADLDGDGEVEYIHAVAGVHMSAYRGNGELLWRYDDPDGAMGYGCQACVWDFNGDGKAEIVCVRGAFGKLRLCMLEGATGRVLNEIEYPCINDFELPLFDDPDLGEKLHDIGHAIRPLDKQYMIGGYIYTANFRGLPEARDILLQIGEQNCVTMVALTDDLEILWEHYCENGKAGHSVGLFDFDGDGCDEMAIGTCLVDHDGKMLWELPFESFSAPWEDDHIDVSVGDDLHGDGKTEIAYSCRLVLDAMTGKRQWIDPTWHGQRVMAAKLRNDLPGMQLIFGDRECRHSGHFIHGEWLDVRDSRGNKLWDRRFMSMNGSQICNWLDNGLTQVYSSPDLQRYSPNPNMQIFDGFGVLVDVLPAMGPNRSESVSGLVPPGLLVQHPDAPLPHGDILVYACGKKEQKISK